MKTSSPLLAWATLPGQAIPIPFDHIKPDQFTSAIRGAMVEHQSEIQTIANNPDPSTFANTIEAMERAGRTLQRVGGVVQMYVLGKMDDEVSKIDEKLSSERTAHDDAILFNSKLFERIRRIHDAPPASLTPEQIRLLNSTWDGFKDAGADLPVATQEQLSKINTRLSVLESRYEAALLTERSAGAIWVRKESELDGLTPEEIETCWTGAIENGRPGAFRIELQNSTQHPYLECLKNRSLRQRLFEASEHRSHPEHSDSASAFASEIGKLRLERATLLGADSHAHIQLKDQMAHDPETAMSAIRKVAGNVSTALQQEAQDLQAIADEMQQTQGKQPFQLAPWDWSFYDHIAQTEMSGVNPEALKQRLLLDRVLEKGVFTALNTLYGIHFEKTDLPTLVPEAAAFQVKAEDGSSIGLLYFDPYSRDDKQGGAWMEAIVQGTRLFVEKSLVSVVLNVSKPRNPEAASAYKSTLNMEDVVTLFHEFGHAVHALFSRAYYPSLAGTNTATDFVELPSMFNERWAMKPELFTQYLLPAENGAESAEELHQKLEQIQHYHKAFGQFEFLAAAAIDLAWHTANEAEKLPTAEQQEDFEYTILEKTGLFNPLVPPRYRSGYFAHAFSGGYDAQYYAYLWSDILAADASAYISESGGLTRANGERFRSLILEKGDTCDPAELYRNWRGCDPEPVHYLRHYGLEDKDVAETLEPSPKL